jgi:hypothetical protein
MTPTGTNLLGLVKHLAGVEYEWLPKTYGRVTEALETEVVADTNAGPQESSADIVAFYGRARAASDAVIAEHGIEDVGTAWFGEQVSLRRVLVGLVEETHRLQTHPGPRS